MYVCANLNKNKGAVIGDAGKPGTLRNGTEPEVIDAQYGRGRRIRVGKLVLIRQDHTPERDITIIAERSEAW